MVCGAGGFPMAISYPYVPGPNVPPVPLGDGHGPMAWDDPIQPHPTVTMEKEHCGWASEIRITRQGSYWDSMGFLTLEIMGFKRELCHLPTGDLDFATIHSMFVGLCSPHSIVRYIRHKA